MIVNKAEMIKLFICNIGQFALKWYSIKLLQLKQIYGLSSGRRGQRFPNSACMRRFRENTGVIVSAVTKSLDKGHFLCYF